MITIKNLSTGEVLKIKYNNKKALSQARDILLGWFFEFNDIEIINEHDKINKNF